MDAFAVMPAETADPDESWAFLNAGVDQVMNNVEGLSLMGYTNLYTTVYNYCTSSKMHGRLDGNHRCMFICALDVLRPKLNHCNPL